MDVNKKNAWIKHWIRAARLKPLIVGIGPVLMGACLSFYQTGFFYWFLNGVIFFCVFCIQIATHFF